MNNDHQLLESVGWTVECESPFEIRHEDGSFASGSAAQIVLATIKECGKTAFEILQEDISQCINNFEETTGQTVGCFICLDKERPIDSTQYLEFNGKNFSSTNIQLIDV